MDFKKLEITTNTIMVYTNCNFDMEKVKQLQARVTDNLKDPIDKIHGELYIEKSDVGSAKRFRNQIHVRIFAIDKCVATKIFKTGKLHFTGCKTTEHAHKAAVALIKKLKELDAIQDLESDDDNITITFETVMVNVGFELDFTVDREKLDNIIQKSSLENVYSIYEPDSQTSVNLKMVYKDPVKKTFDQIVLKPNGEYYQHKVDSSPKSKKVEEREHTFLVFGGSNKGKTKHKSKVIQSGRYYDTQMEPAFKKFLNFINENRTDIEMKSDQKNFDISQLVGVF
jgi:hypothetical protein